MTKLLVQTTTYRFTVLEWWELFSKLVFDSVSARATRKARAFHSQRVEARRKANTAWAA